MVHETVPRVFILNPNEQRTVMEAQRRIQALEVMHHVGVLPRQRSVVFLSDAFWMTSHEVAEMVQIDETVRDEKGFDNSVVMT